MIELWEGIEQRDARDDFAWETRGKNYVETTNNKIIAALYWQKVWEIFIVGKILQT